MAKSIADRKEEHLLICLNHDVSFQEIRTGFDNIQLEHCALPEINLTEVDTGIQFLGKRLSMPLMITGMTGGFQGAKETNRKLARVCHEQKIALGLGSQRQTMENSYHLKSFSVVRDRRLDIPLIGNIGAAQIVRRKSLDQIRRMVELIQADALAVHLNPLQEVLQPEGDTNFKGVLEGIDRLVKNLGIPIIVKETGAGISGKVAKRLKEVGVEYIDISGAGGTSWAAVEYHRSQNKELARKFWDWGIPTLRCLKEVSQIPGVRVIASGGIRSGIDIAKALVLGAELAGVAHPFLITLFSEGEQGLSRLIQDWKTELKTVMFLTGCQQIKELKGVKFFEKKEFGGEM